MFSDSELRMARIVARLACRRSAALRAYGEEDLRQDLLLHWWRVRGRYRPGEASWQTWMNRVLTRKAIDIGRSLTADRRKTLAMGEPIEAG